MTGAIELKARGFAYAPGVFQYSAGVAALPGYRIERVRFARVVPVADGWARIAAYLTAQGLPMTSFCACELRSPAPFTEDGFLTFNRAYAAVLQAWNVLTEQGNPVARSNVCPEIAPPAEPCFHAFVYTVPDAGAAPSFAVAGSGEAAEGKGDYRSNTVALGDISPAGMRAKARWVLGEMERRMGLLGADWRATTGVQAYTVHDMAPFFAEEIVRRGAARHGLTWQYGRPPVKDLEFEMDCRGIAREIVLT